MICSFLWTVYDFKGQRESTIQEWLDDERISKKQRGVLNQKMDMLELVGMDLPPKLLAGPLDSKTQKLKSKNIYKLIIKGDVMLRPFLCRGPINNDTELTMLLGVIERNFKNDHDPAEGEERRGAVIADQSKRIKHVRYR